MSLPDVEKKIGEALRDMHDVVMRAERAQEALHRAFVLQAISTADRDALGRLFLQHIRCCWDDELRPVVMDRIRELSDAEMMEAPF